MANRPKPDKARGGCNDNPRSLEPRGDSGRSSFSIGFVTDSPSTKCGVTFGGTSQARAAMFDVHQAGGYRELLPGIRQKTRVFGENTLLAEFVLARDSLLPLHAHPYEQTGYLVQGRIRLRIGDEEFDARAGDSWCIPANVEHGAHALEDTVAVEVFSPVREDYLPKGD